MDLHHHAVLGGKSGHLGHHLAAEELGLLGGKRTLQRLVEQRLFSASGRSDVKAVGTP